MRAAPIVMKRNELIKIFYYIRPFRGVQSGADWRQRFA